MKKEAVLNIQVSRRLHDAIQAEAKRHNATIAAYVRAVMSRQVFGNHSHRVVDEEWIVEGTDGDVLSNG